MNKITNYFLPTEISFLFYICIYISIFKLQMHYISFGMVCDRQ